MPYDSRSSKRKLKKAELLDVLRKAGISDAEFRRWLGISVDKFCRLNPALRWVMFQFALDDYLESRVNTKRRPASPTAARGL